MRMIGIGQKVNLRFSIQCYRKPWMNFLANPFPWVEPRSLFLHTLHLALQLHFKNEENEVKQKWPKLFLPSGRIFTKNQEYKYIWSAYNGQAFFLVAVNKTGLSQRAFGVTIQKLFGGGGGTMADIEENSMAPLRAMEGLRGLLDIQGVQCRKWRDTSGM